MPPNQRCSLGGCAVLIWHFPPGWELLKVKGVIWLISILPALAHSAQQIPHSTHVKLICSRLAEGPVLRCTSECPGGLVKTDSWPHPRGSGPGGLGGGLEFAFLTSSQARLLLLILESPFENHQSTFNMDVFPGGINSSKGRGVVGSEKAMWINADSKDFRVG